MAFLRHQMTFAALQPHPCPAETEIRRMEAGPKGASRNREKEEVFHE